MKLRDHPLMRYRGLSNWPPAWTPHSTSGQERQLREEIGILKQVERDVKTTRKCYLVIEHEAREYMGTLLFDDAMFGWLVSVNLRKHIGKPIKEIGEIDLSHTL